jgi:hypothetical protein
MREIPRSVDLNNTIVDPEVRLAGKPVRKFKENQGVSSEVNFLYSIAFFALKPFMAMKEHLIGREEETSS